MRVEEVAKMLGVEKSVAYGLLQYMRANNLIETEKAVKAEGSRGKPAILYSFNALSVQKLYEHLSARLAGGFLADPGECKI